MKVLFSIVFNKNSDGSLEPRQRIRVGGVTLGPGTKFQSGVSFGGIDFTQFEGHNLEVQQDGDVLVITGIY